MRSSFISSKHIFSFMLSEIWPFVYPTQYFGKEILFFSKTKKYWREEGLRSEQLPNFLHILMFLKFSKFKSFIQLNVYILNIAGFFSSQGEKKKKRKASCKLRMSPDSGCLWSISIRVLVYSGFIPGHKAGPRWLPLTREQCMTDHERLL